MLSLMENLDAKNACHCFCFDSSAIRLPEKQQVIIASLDDVEMWLLFCETETSL